MSLLMFLATTTCLFACSCLPNTSCYVFWSYQAHLWFHCSKTFFGYNCETQWYYDLWTQSSPLFVDSQKNLNHLLEDQHKVLLLIAYDDWVANDCSVMTWLLNNMNENVSAIVMFMKEI